jgi:pSer/pThr/pTyr-binding forkhead associated (FHA) protein
MPRLVITKGPGTGRDHAVGTEAVVGRAPDVDFVLEDSLVSRRHARVFREGDAYVVEDLGSRNGIYANGKRVPRLRLDDGATFTVGETEISFRQKSLVETGARAPVVTGRPPPPRPGAVVPSVVPARPAVPPVVPARPAAAAPAAPVKPVPVVPKAAPPAAPARPAAPPPASEPVEPAMPSAPPVPGSFDAPPPPPPPEAPPAPQGGGTDGPPPPAPPSGPPRRRRLIS